MEALQRVLEASPDAILLVDDRGRVLEANRNVEAVLGYTPAELEGMVVETLLLEADREDHVAYREAYLPTPSRDPWDANSTSRPAARTADPSPSRSRSGPSR